MRSPAHPTSVDEYAEWNTSLLAREPVTRRTLLKGVAGGAGGIALAQFGLAQAAFAAGGGTAGTSGVVISGRHLSFVQGRDGRPSSAMAMTAQLVSKDGSLPRRLKAYVEVGTAPGVYGTRIEAEIVHLIGQYAIPGGPIGSQFYAKAKISGLRPESCPPLPIHAVRRGRRPATRTSPPRRGTRATSAGWRPPSPSPPSPTSARTTRRPTRSTPGVRTRPSSPAPGGTWPRGTFDDNYYSATDPIAGTNGTDPRPAVSNVNGMAGERPVFTLLAGDICYADPGGSGLPADDSGAISGKNPPGTNLYNPYVWDVFLNQIEPQAAYTPWMFATGNHDMEPLYGKTSFLGDSANHGYGGHAARLGPAGQRAPDLPVGV